MRSESSMLLAAIDGVARRLAVRRVALGAALGAMAAVPVAAAWAGTHATVVVLVVAAVAACAGYGWRRRSIDWLAHRDRGGDLIVSAAAVASGTTRRTALADRVEMSGARAVDSLRPSLLPGVFGLVAIASAVAILPRIATSRSARPVQPGHAAAGAPEPAEPHHVVRADPPVATSADSNEPDVDRERERAVEPASTHAMDAPGGVGSGASTSGGGELHGSSVVSAARSNRTVDANAPIAGASAELIAVPARYRGLARAFLEAR